MIPLILLALGLGAALTAYELSPRTRSRVDAYVHAIQSANTSHQTADAHLENANAAARTAVRHVQQANMASQQAWSAPAPTQWATMPAPVPVQQPPSQPAPYVPPPTQDIANAQANAAQAAVDAARAAIDTVVDHAAQALAANQEAAQNTADAAQSAETEADRQSALQSAVQVLEREKKIAAALAGLGVGQCGVRPYEGVTEAAKNKLLAKLDAEGMTVTGDNPWNIDTKTYGVKLRAVWDPKAQRLKLIVTTGKNFIVTCDAIWERIDPKIRGAIG